MPLVRLGIREVTDQHDEFLLSAKHDVEASTSLGHSNTSAMYVAQWLHADHESCKPDNPSALHGPISNGMWTASGINFSAVRQVLQSRYGHLYNNKLALSYGHPLLGRAAHNPRGRGPANRSNARSATALTRGPICCATAAMR